MSDRGLRQGWSHSPELAPGTLLLAGDVLAIILGVTIALGVGEEHRPPTLVGWLWPTALVTGLWLFWGRVFNAYRPNGMHKPSNRLYVAAMSTASVVLPVAFVVRAIPIFAAQITPASTIGAVAAIVAFRLIVTPLISRMARRRHVFVYGAGGAGRAIARTIHEDGFQYNLVGYVDDDEEKHGRTIDNAMVLGRCEDLPTLVKRHNVSDIVLAVRPQIQASLVRALSQCLENGVRIIPMPELYEKLTGRVPIEHLNEGWLGFLPRGPGVIGLYPIVKRALDVILATTGLMALAVLLPFVAIAIKLDSSGPVFYAPERLGRGGRPFKLWKFRTMVLDADRIGDPTFTSENDERITRVGGLLRATHIDEFPQFINVLRGEMSAVGPRPERHVPELEEQIPFFRVRYAVRPGMAGWALVNQGYAQGSDATTTKLQYDLYYIKYQSIMLDLVILVRTIFHAVSLRGR